MYFWNINALAKELRENTVSHDEQVKYYIAATLIYMFSARIPQFSNPADPLHAALFSAIAFGLKIAVVVWGILYSYQFNKRGDDKDFQVRFVALSIPATVRYMLLVTITTLLLIALFHTISIFQIKPHILTLAEFSYDILLLLFSFAYYRYIATKIKYVAGLIPQRATDVP